MSEDMPTLDESKSGSQLRSSVVSPRAAAVLIVVSATVLVLTRGQTPDGQRRPLPRDAAEATRWEGAHVTITSGISADHRAFTFQVSREHFGGYCAFLYVASKPGEPPMGGGGGCGSADPVSSSSGGNGGVCGLTSMSVASVDVVTQQGTVTLPTMALPSPFDQRRYFLVVLPAGTSPSKITLRSSSGSVIES